LDLFRIFVQVLGLEENWAFSERDSASAVNRLSQQMEAIGVITAFNGVVGNNTRRKLSVEECRGFALVSKIAPFVFVNNDDAKSAQLFTLIHEFAHLLLGVSAGFGGIDPHNDSIEKFCDQEAATFLVPEMLFVAQWKMTEGDIEKCARKFTVSPVVIARRAYGMNMLSAQDYQMFYTRYKAIWKNQKKSSGSGSGNFYLSAAKRVGRLFGAYISTAVSSGYLLHRDAYSLTGLHGKSFDKVITNRI
ncbi:MAG: ImmA/IrrE family metallo-endopeptidase, partial [Muribaculaceae bacterium]